MLHSHPAARTRRAVHIRAIQAQTEIPNLDYMLDLDSHAMAVPVWGKYVAFAEGLAGDFAAFDRLLTGRRRTLAADDVVHFHDFGRARVDAHLSEDRSRALPRGRRRPRSALDDFVVLLRGQRRWGETNEQTHGISCARGRAPILLSSRSLD
jgi:hypothetical protein